MSGTAGRDELFLRLSFAVARRSLTHGNHPFGCIVVDSDGKVLIETENGYMPDHDGTAHAERLAATLACRTLGRDVLAKATLYSSAEPCDVRRRDLLGRHRPRRLWPQRASPARYHRQPS